MFMDAGNPGFFKIVGAIRVCLATNERYYPLMKFGNPLVFEAARTWIKNYEKSCIVCGEEWAWDKMVHKHFDEFIEQSLHEAYNKIVERIGYQAWLESHMQK